MNTPKSILRLSLVISFLLVACNTDSNENPTPSLPTTVAPATIEPEASGLDEVDTVIKEIDIETEANDIDEVDAVIEEVDIETEANDIDAIDTIIGEIDNDMCQQALEFRAEIEGLAAQGEDVAELETAVIDLIQELENCSLEMTPTP